MTHVLKVHGQTLKNTRKYEEGGIYPHYHYSETDTVYILLHFFCIYLSMIIVENLQSTKICENKI